jgi:hypothetical protein
VVSSPYPSAKRHQTGVTDQYVEPAKAILRLLDEQRQVFTFGDIDRLNIHLALALANVVGDGFQPVGPACAENDLRSGSGQYSSGRFADPAGCARDCDNFSRYVRHVLPVLLQRFVVGTIGFRTRSSDVVSAVFGDTPAARFPGVTNARAARGVAARRQANI